jgi:hypothetical protein
MIPSQSLLDRITFTTRKGARFSWRIEEYTRDAPDTDFSGYPAGRISGLSKIRIPDIRPDIRCKPDIGYPVSGRLPDIKKAGLSGRISDP